MHEHQADQLLKEVLDHPGEPSWSGDTEIADLPQIDSLKQTNLILSVEARLGRKLDLDELLGLETVADLRRLPDTAHA